MISVAMVRSLPATPGPCRNLPSQSSGQRVPYHTDDMQTLLSERPSRWRTTGLVGLIFGVVLACYWPAMHGALLWDDPAHVTRPELRSWAGLGRIWEIGATQEYYPVLHSAFWLEWRVWGDSLFAYHLLNVALHAASCCLLALVLRRLWAAPVVAARAAPPADSGVPTGTEWLAALLFAVHPVCVESVAWITEQKNTLSLFFYLASALAYLNFTALRRRRWYCAALGLFLLALGAKTASVTLPASLLVVLWWKNGSLSWRRDVWPLIPWFVIAVGAGLLTVGVETKLVGAEGAPYAWSIVQRLLLAGRVIWFYVGKLAWPADLIFFYPHWDVPAVAATWWGYLAAAMAVTAVLWSIRRRYRGLFAGWLLFIGALFPVAGLFNVFAFIFSQVADHFQYMAVPSAAAVTAAGVTSLLARMPAGARLAGRVLCGSALFVLAVQAHRQSRLYIDNETLFQATVARNPQAWMAYQILGATLAKSPSRHAEAMACYQEVLRFNPDYPDAHVGLAVELAKLPGRSAEAVAHLERALQLRPHYVEAHNNLGVELAKLPGRLPDAMAHFEAALALKPGFAEAHVNLADALVQLPGRLPEAMAHYQEALRIRPDYAKAHHDFARALAELPGRLPDAVAHYEEALRLNPDYAEAHYNLANALARLPDRTLDAIGHYEQALRLNPNFAEVHYNLANILAFFPGRMSEALPHYLEALRLRPDFAEAHANLANVLAQLPGRLPEALAHYEAALQINPNLAWVHFNLALHLAQIPGREAEAITHGEEALRIRPDYPEALNCLAIVYARQGRPDKARANWEEALQLNPNFEEARQNLRILERMTKR
jgi:protein O-mannosyl-transferase